MKKVLLLAACIVMASGAFAQFSWGIKGGLNISSLTNVPNNQMKTGIYVGAFAEYQFNDFIAIQPEIIYSRQGVSHTIEKTVTDREDVKSRNRFRANYINIPILAKVYLLDNLSLDLGPQIGFVLTAKEFGKSVDTKNGRDVSIYKSRMDKNSYNTFDVSIAMGLTYKLNANLFVSARYNLGLTDFLDKDFDWKDKYDWGKTRIAGKNSVIQLGIGVAF